MSGMGQQGCGIARNQFQAYSGAKVVVRVCWLNSTITWPTVRSPVFCRKDASLCTPPIDLSSKLDLLPNEEAAKNRPTL